MSAAIRFVLIMGVAGSGKTTVGRLVARDLGWNDFEGDDFHPEANRAKMAAGSPLDDRDRAPWLAAIRAKMDACRAAGGTGVFTCSALKESYRQVLLGGTDDVLLVFLQGSPAAIEARVARRQGHFMKAGMVRSQFEALEVPADAFVIDIGRPAEAIAAQIANRAGKAAS